MSSIMPVEHRLSRSRRSAATSAPAAARRRARGQPGADQPLEARPGARPGNAERLDLLELSSRCSCASTSPRRSRLLALRSEPAPRRPPAARPHSRGGTGGAPRPRSAGARGVLRVNLYPLRSLGPESGAGAARPHRGSRAMLQGDGRHDDPARLRLPLRARPRPLRRSSSTSPASSRTPFVPGPASASRPSARAGHARAPRDDVELVDLDDPRGAPGARSSGPSVVATPRRVSARRRRQPRSSREHARGGRHSLVVDLRVAWANVTLFDRARVVSVRGGRAALRTG